MGKLRTRRTRESMQDLSQMISLWEESALGGLPWKVSKPLARVPASALSTRPVLRREGVLGGCTGREQ